MKNIKIFSLIKTILTVIYCFSINSSAIISQSCYHPFVDSIISQVSLQSICKYNRELTGDTTTIVNNQPVLIYSRYWEHPSNQVAAQYIYEKFAALGLETLFAPFGATGVNVLGIKQGVKYPNQKVIICGHYDNITHTFPQPDTIHGADDNASGVCAVLEAARILSQYNWDYTVVFAAWDEEEMGIFGSSSYAASAYIHGDSIINVINVDMIAWDGNNDGIHEIITNARSLQYANIASGCDKIYVNDLIPYIYVASSGGSDYYPFWKKGYNAIGYFESGNDPNPYYHTVNDKFEYLNQAYFHRIVKAAIASLVVMLKDYTIFIEHDKLLSTTDTSARIAAVKIYSNHGVAGIDSGSTENRPRLYYRINDGPFSYIFPFISSQNEIKYLIPGQTPGTKVSYYIAAQSVTEDLLGSMPEGARGLNPPGTIPPSELITYYVLSSQNLCSNTVPKDIPPKQAVFDTINVLNSKLLYDANINITINHTNDSDLQIWLVRPGYPLRELSISNGGTGDNYINTTFDDEAVDSIKNGTAPFTGSFIPEQSLSYFDDKTTEGEWILKIFNNSNEITGQLVSWCIRLESYNPIGVTNSGFPLKYSLSQNYPNPFNPITKIEYSINKESDVKIIVHDMIGREVRMLVNRRMLAGNYSTVLNGYNLASGLYFYSMYIDDKLFETKKMVLLK